METTEKIIIYQVFTRLFGNQNKTCRPNGSLEENGCGKSTLIKTILQQVNIGQAGYERKNVQQINTQQSGSSYVKLLVTDGEIRTASTRVVEL